MNDAMRPTDEMAVEPRSDDGVGAALAAAAAGNPDAFRAVVRRFGPGIVAFCARAGGDRDAADDLAQEVFLRAWRSLPRYRPELAFSTWLYRIALNLCRDHRRRVAVRRPRDGARLVPVADDDAPANGPGPADRAAASEEAGRALAALDRLDELEREVVVLRAMSGLSFREVADALDLAPSTAKNRFAAALRRLRGWLTNRAPASGRAAAPSETDR